MSGDITTSIDLKPSTEYLWDSNSRQVILANIKTVPLSPQIPRGYRENGRVHDKSALAKDNWIQTAGAAHPITTWDWMDLIRPRESANDVIGSFGKPTHELALGKQQGIVTVIALAVKPVRVILLSFVFLLFRFARCGTGE
ncbi:hypothetical protein V8F33_002093 [Rhypophila sp. PSN 637]